MSLNNEISNPNFRWANFLLSLGYQVEFEKKVGDYRYDLFIEELDLLIEVNPTETHNSTLSLNCIINKCNPGCTKHRQIPKDYHRNKTLSAVLRGYHVLNIYDWVTTKNVEDFLLQVESKIVTSYPLPLGFINLLDLPLSKVGYQPFMKEVEFKGKKVKIHAEGLLFYDMKEMII